MCRGVIVISIILTLGSAASAQVRVPATDASIDYVGRWGRLTTPQGTAMATVNSGSQILVKFRSTHISGLFYTDTVSYLPQIKIRIDGGAWRMFTVDRPQIDFCSSCLPEVQHELEIAVKDVDARGDHWSLPLESGLIFEGFVVDSGGVVARPDVRLNPRIEFYGDSITQGVRVIGMQVGPVGTDCLLSYGWLTGEILDLTHTHIGFSGQGVIRPGNGGVPPAALTFAWNYAGSPADFFQPAEYIVINLGTNDARDPANEFAAAYLDFLNEVRKHCPKSAIFAMRPFGGFHGEEVAAAVRKMNDPRIHYVDTAGWLENTDYLDLLHPNVEGSRKAARKLADVLRPYIAH